MTALGDIRSVAIPPDDAPRRIVRAAFVDPVRRYSRDEYELVLELGGDEGVYPSREVFLCSPEIATKIVGAMSAAMFFIAQTASPAEYPNGIRLSQEPPS